MLWRCYTCQQQYVFILANRLETTFFSAIDRFELVVFYGSEKQRLVGIEIHGFCKNSNLHGLERFRTFGNNDNVSPVLAFFRFAQIAGGQ